MIAAIELSKDYAQICVKTDAMREPESVTKIAGAEHYRIPIDCNLDDREGMQKLFRRLWKLLMPYKDRENLEMLLFCLEENTEPMRRLLEMLAESYHIPLGSIHFLDRAECFCAYVFNQSADLSANQVLLIENRGEDKKKVLLGKCRGTLPVILKVQDISEKTLKQIFSEQAVSSVFLVGEDFEESWMEENLKLLKSGRRVFLGKNLFVKGACYRGMELAAGKKDYLYLSGEKLCFHVAVKCEKDGKERYVPILEGGKNWYESETETEVLLLGEPVLELALIPISGKGIKEIRIPLENLPRRPKRTTRLMIRVKFSDPVHGMLTIRDQGFGELFPQSDMVYEGELQWEA